MTTSTVKLYGEMVGKFGREFQLAVNSTREAIKALSVQVEGFEKYMMEAEARGIRFAVFYGKKNISADEIDDWNAGEEIRIAPIIMGSKKQGVFQTIVGAVLVVVGMVLTAYGYGAIGKPMAKFGWSMAIGGVVQMLAPSPKGRSSQDDANKQSSYNFNGPVNSEAQGGCVSVLYGKPWCGSKVVYASINVEDSSFTPSTRTANGSGGGTIIQRAKEANGYYDEQEF